MTAGRPGKRRERLSPFALGLLAILAIVIFVFGAFSKRVPFTPRYEVKGVFASSNQIREGSPVRIAGVDVGQVSAVDPGPGSTTIVKMTIKDAGQPVHSDATAKIRPRVFLEGGYFVDLHPGSPSAPKLRGGATIPLPQTAVPVQFHQVLSALDRNARSAFQGMVRETATALDGGGAQGLRRTLRPLAPTLRDVARVSQAARGTAPDDLFRLVQAASRLTRVLATREADLADTVTSLNRTAAALADNDAALAAGIRELDGVMRATPPALAALDRAMPPLESFARAIRPGLRVAPPVLDRAADLLVQLDALARSPNRPSEFVQLVIDLRPVLPEVPRLSLLARGLFPFVGPVVTCLRDNLVPVLNSRLDDGGLSSGRPVWQDLVHTLTGFAGGTQSFDANGPWTRYLGTTGSETVSTGNVPGAGTLFGGTSDPILGVRPKWKGTNGFPPFRPDQNCANQQPPNLKADVAPYSGGGP